MNKQSTVGQSITSNRVIVVLGPGGVGKTTCSIAAAVLGAKLGLRVGLLSIDPARRLAAAMGISLSGELSEVHFDQVDGVKGSLSAAMLDQKSVFDDMVRRHAPSTKISDTILNHSLYQASSAKLAGPLEYMALAKLQQMVESNEFDLVVLDTPPDTNALDFLKRPNILAGFMENKVMGWLVKPFYFASKFGAEKIFSTGERLMGGVAKVTGLKALAKLAEFLVLIQDVIEGFHRSGEKIIEILKDKRTVFFMVATATAASRRSTENLLKQVSAMGYKIDTVFLNRCIPDEVVHDLDLLAVEGTHPLLANDQVQKFLLRLAGERAAEAQIRQAVVAVCGSNTVFRRVEEQKNELHSLPSIISFSSAFDKARSV